MEGDTDQENNANEVNDLDPSLTNVCDDNSDAGESHPSELGIEDRQPEGWEDIESDDNSSNCDGDNPGQDDWDETDMEE